MKAVPKFCFFLCLLLATIFLFFTPWPLTKKDVLAPGSARAAVARSSATVGPTGIAGKVQPSVRESYGKLPLTFEANQGQTDPHVKFISRSSGYTLYLTSTEAVLASLQTSGSVQPTSRRKSPQVFSIGKDIGEIKKTRPNATRDQAQKVLRMKLVEANLTASIEGLDQLPGKSNYFIGNDPIKWRTNIPTFAKVRYKDVYPGVDLVYYGNQRQLEYDFIVVKGGSPRAIRLAIMGVRKFDLDISGDLVLDTDQGESRLHKPIVYQEVGGTRKEIAGQFVLRGNRQIGFEVAAYDTDKPLIIDPVLSYSTYLGGDSDDSGTSIAVDLAGNAYVTGSTGSFNFPTKNPLQAKLGDSANLVDGFGDAFVAKLDPTGSNLIYSTYLGGSGSDSGSGIAVDSAGNAYVTGSTRSSDFPTASAFQAACASCSKGGVNAFVTKLSATGSALLYSTYLGGSSSDFGSGIAVDSAGNAYVTGSTNSSNFPTKNPLQANSGAPEDAFVTKFGPTGSALLYSTYLGGSGGNSGSGIAVDSAGNAYVTGSTSSSNFPTKNPLQANLGGGGGDAFVAKLDPTGAALVYSTYLGGSGSDFGNGIAVDSAGNAYVTGGTASSDFPTSSPFQGTCGGCSSGQPSAFVSKLNAAGSALVYSTYLGGSGNGADGDVGQAIAVDAANSAYVTGLTSSPNFPLASPIESSPLVLQTCLDYYYGGSFTCGNTAFVTQLNAVGSAPVYSTYLGANGGNFEEGFGIAVDSAGNAYVTGTANSGFLMTPGTFQTSPGGYTDAFVAKISPNAGLSLSLSSFALDFRDEAIGGTTTQQITLANTGSTTLTIANIAPSAGDFSEVNTCGSSLTGGTSCIISVTFNPTAAGVRTGAITITDSVASSPQHITLTGNGVAGLAATVSPTSLNFGNQTQGTTGASQNVTFTNTGSTTLTMTGFSIAGVNPTDFSISTSTCFQSQSLAVGASCAFTMVFTPQAAGNLSATLQILDNSAQSPRSVALTGVGIAPPTVTLSAASLSFAAQAVGGTSSGQSITLTTSGSGTLVLSSISPSSDFRASNNCGRSLAGGGSCTITVTFTPTVVGSRMGTLVIVDNATDSPQLVSLSGIGMDFAISPSAGSSSSATVTAGQPATYTLSVAGTTSAFSGTVSLSCSDPAPQSTCSVSPNSLTVNGTTAANATVTVTTTARSATPPHARPRIVSPGLRVALPWLLLILSLVILTRALRCRSRRWAWLSLTAMLLAAALFPGCGAPQGTPVQGTPAGTYIITASATSGGTSRTTTLSLTAK